MFVYMVFLTTVRARHQRQSTAHHGIICRRCRRQRKQVLLELWNLKLEKSYFITNSHFYFTWAQKKTLLFIFDMGWCVLVVKLEKVKIQFVIVRSIIKGKTTCRCASHTHVRDSILIRLHSTQLAQHMHGLPSVRISVVFYRCDKSGHGELCNILRWKVWRSSEESELKVEIII